MSPPKDTYIHVIDAYSLDTVLHDSQRIRPKPEYLFTGARGNMGAREMSGFNSKSTLMGTEVPHWQSSLYHDDPDKIRGQGHKLSHE